MAGAGAIDRRRNARNAIEKVAAGLGLPTDLTILSERWNLVAKPGDQPIVIKAAALADLAKTDPAMWFRLETDMCAALDQRGVNVQVPFGDRPFQIVDGIPVTVWHEVPGEIGAAPEAVFVTALAELHTTAAGLDPGLPWFATLTTHFADMAVKLPAHSGLPSATVARLLDLAERTMDAIAALDLPCGFIHGDAQRKNAMWDGETVRWIDLEECSIGPFAWDLACFTMNPRYDSARVRRHYADLTGTPYVSDRALATLQYARDLEGLTWMLCIQSEREDAFRDEAQTLLADVLSRSPWA